MTDNLSFGAWTLYTAMADIPIVTHRRRWNRSHAYPSRTFQYTLTLPPWIIADLTRSAYTRYARRCAGAFFSTLAQLSPERGALLLEIFRTANGASQQDHDAAWCALRVLLKEMRCGD